MGVPTDKRPCLYCRRLLPSQLELQQRIIVERGNGFVASEIVFQLFGYCGAGCEVQHYADHLKKHAPDVEL